MVLLQSLCSSPSSNPQNTSFLTILSLQILYGEGSILISITQYQTWKTAQNHIDKRCPIDQTLLNYSQSSSLSPCSPSLNLLAREFLWKMDYAEHQIPRLKMQAKAHCEYQLSKEVIVNSWQRSHIATFVLQSGII